MLLDVITIFEEKNDNWPPGSGAAGLQVHSGQVKIFKKLFKELEVNLLNQICVFLDVIIIFEGKLIFGLQVQVLQASRSILDR